MIQKYYLIVISYDLIKDSQNKYKKNLMTEIDYFYIEKTNSLVSPNTHKKTLTIM